MSLVPWSSGRPLVWDATCPDTLEVWLPVEQALWQPLRRRRGMGSILTLAPTYLFHPAAIETSGAIGPRSRTFLQELGRQVRQESGEANSTSYLLDCRGCPFLCSTAYNTRMCLSPVTMNVGHARKFLTIKVNLVLAACSPYFQLGIEDG